MTCPVEIKVKTNVSRYIVSFFSKYGGMLGSDSCIYIFVWTDYKYLANDNKALNAGIKYYCVVIGK